MRDEYGEDVLTFSFFLYSSEFLFLYDDEHDNDDNDDFKDLVVLAARSPIFSHLSVSLHGLATLRAFDSQNVFMDQFDEVQVCALTKNLSSPFNILSLR